MELIHPDDRKTIDETSVPASEKCYVEFHQSFDYRIRHKSGEYRWYCHRAVIDLDDNGKAVRMAGSIADIQDRKNTEVLAKEGIRLRDNFLSMLSHELRNPMGAVTNALSSLDCESSEESSQELMVIRRQTQQMARLLDDLLDVARFGRDKIEFRKEIVDLCGLVAPVIESVDYQLEEKEQRLKTSVCEGPLNIIGDPSRISQAQTNLIVNASKFSNTRTEILYSIERGEEEAIISVTDSGAGIAPEMLKSVFGLFVQSEHHAIGRSAGGMGVGLSITQKIVNAHNGSVTAHSDGHGHGSKFEIRLPLTTLLHDKREAEESAELDRSLTCKVMLVEDNVDARDMLAKTFRRRDFDVLAVGDGKAAIQQFPDFEPAVAVIDIGLPGISGFEIASTIRQNELWNDVLLVALTGFGQKSDQEAIFKAGFDHHIVKPLQFSALHDIILRHLSKPEST